MTEHEFIRHYDEFSDALFRHCYFRVFERERAKDLVQETFVRTWDYLSRGKHIDSPKAFLYRVLNNLIIDESRKRRTLSLDALSEEGFDPGHDERPERVVALEVRHILRFLDKLGPGERDIVVMRYVDDLGPKEISEVLGIRENAVSVRLHRAVQRLRSLMHDHG